MAPSVSGCFQNFVDAHCAVSNDERIKQGRMMQSVRQAVRRLDPTWVVTYVGSQEKHTSTPGSDIDVLVDTKGSAVTRPSRRAFKEYLLEAFVEAGFKPEAVIARRAVKTSCGKTCFEVVFTETTYDEPLPRFDARGNSFRNKPGLQRAVRALKLLPLLRESLCGLGPGYRYEALGLIAAELHSISINFGESSSDATGYAIFKTALELLRDVKPLQLNDRMSSVICKQLGIEDSPDVAVGKLECWANYSRAVLKALDKPDQITSTRDVRRVFEGSEPVPLAIARTPSSVPSAASTSDYEDYEDYAPYPTVSYPGTRHTPHARMPASASGTGRAHQQDQHDEAGWSNTGVAVGVATVALAGWALWGLTRSRRKSNDGRS